MSADSDTSSAIKEHTMGLPGYSASTSQDSNITIDNHESSTNNKKAEILLAPLPVQESLRLSKNKLRKKRNYEKILTQRPIKRKREKELRKQKGLNKKSLGKDEKFALTEKLKAALNGTNQVVIDCQFDDKMSDKQRDRLAQQLRRVYASNKASQQPVHLTFSSLPESSEFFQLCCRKNDGFSNYVIDRKEQNVSELFSNDKIVYLSPDSTNVLSEFWPDKVYVIGGIVDESRHKNISLSFSKSIDITTARLPIDEYFVAEKGSGGTFKKVLCVNQVFDIILEWHKTKDWVKAITAGLPERAGFVAKST
ncbi:tRNA methyltransferase 10 homolog B-like isoform X2 [Folsomia candida]|uniref:tRNA methyltransferase 10 homolog B-like isoform X2 n=1 Tax=Folsomia candida TaxID=158441 RepID=UPI000B909E09|nr:tRNA methyltransferase 10 homolog B-like isoform X2 [Folsomia candida]